MASCQAWRRLAAEAAPCCRKWSACFLPICPFRTSQRCLGASWDQRPTAKNCCFRSRLRRMLTNQQSQRPSSPTLRCGIQRNFEAAREQDIGGDRSGDVRGVQSPTRDAARASAHVWAGQRPLNGVVTSWKRRHETGLVCGASSGHNDLAQRAWTWKMF
jgi:hypothetical protein